MSNYNIENPVLSRFFDNLPDYPHCTDTLEAGCRQAPKHIAAQYRYIEPNKPNYWCAYLNFDLDYDGAYFATHDLDLPPETICVVNPQDGKGHIGYEFTVPIHLGGNASEKAIHYLEVIRKVYTRELEADPSFGGMLTKNPLSDQFRVYTWNVTYTLDELAEPLRDVTIEQIRSFPDDELWHEHLKDYPIPLYEKKPKKIRITSDDPDDSLFVFHNTRWWAYTIIADCKRVGQLRGMIEARIRKLNRNFNLNLSESRIRSDTNSITKWCWNHRSDFIAKRKAFCEIQRERAYSSHKSRKRNTSAKLSKARQKLRRQGKVITKSALAEETGLSRRALDKRTLKTDPLEAKRIGAYNSHEVRRVSTEAKIKQVIDTFTREGRKISKSAIAREAGVSRQLINKCYSHLFDL